MEARLCAAYRAHQKFMRRDSPASVIALAERLDCRKPCSEPIAVWTRKKPDGSERTICGYGLEQTARHHLTDALLKASIANIPHWQFEHRGRGHGAAVEAVKAYIRQGYSFAATLDVADCFASFDREKVISLLPLPGEVTRHVLMASDRMLSHSPHTNSISRSAHHAVQSHNILGLPQGSVASNRIASFLLADLGSAVSERCKLVGFRDDFVILGPSEKVVNESFESLRRLLLEHRAGSFRLGRCGATAVEEGFEFLGYKIYGIEKVPILNLSEKNLEKYRAIFGEALRRDLREEFSSPANVRKALAGRTRAFPHWTFAAGAAVCYEILAERLLNKVLERELSDERVYEFYEIEGVRRRL